MSEGPVSLQTQALSPVGCKLESTDLPCVGLCHKSRSFSPGWIDAVLQESHEGGSDIGIREIDRLRQRTRRLGPLAQVAMVLCAAGVDVGTLWIGLDSPGVESDHLPTVFRKRQTRAKSLGGGHIGVEICNPNLQVRRSQRKGKLGPILRLSAVGDLASQNPERFGSIQTVNPKACPIVATISTPQTQSAACRRPDRPNPAYKEKRLCSGQH